MPAYALTDLLTDILTHLFAYLSVRVVCPVANIFHLWVCTDDQWGVHRQQEWTAGGVYDVRDLLQLVR